MTNQPFSGHRAWWKEGIIYQIYPRSFQDSNGDGIGDIPGILSRLDYIESLGVSMIWMNPVYASPNDDNGYDISDYTSIMKEYGTMKDFDRLLEELHKRGIRLLMDLVVNHTSDEHHWFREAKKSRKNRYYNYYHWWPAEKGAPPHRFSFFDPEGSAWAYNKATDSYYLHYFSRRMPDLNWENPELRKEIYAMMRFWFDKGVDGFRLDAITYISKDVSWPKVSDRELKSRYQNDWSFFYSRGPNLHNYLREMHEEAFSNFDIATIAEAPGISIDEALLFVKEERRELHMLYHFEGMRLGYIDGGFKRPDPNGYDLVEFKEIYTNWDRVFEQSGWGTVYLGNHDQPRMTSRWGNEKEGFLEMSAKLLITFLLTMRATPIFYNGDELGMTNIRFDNIKDYRDVETISMYQYLKSRKEDLKRFILDQQFGARDNGRTPFQWDATPNAGFTTGKPWIKINDNHSFLNAAAQHDNPDSVLNYFRKLVRLRKERLTLVYGEYMLDEPFHKQLYVYTRTLGEEMLLIVLNFSEDVVVYQLPRTFSIAGVLVNNHTSVQMDDERITLLPYQALIFECSKEG